jgi:hypothetical protein
MCCVSFPILQVLWRQTRGRSLLAVLAHLWSYSPGVESGDKLWITWPYRRDVSLASCLKLRISRVYTVSTQRKVEEP